MANVNFWIAFAAVALAGYLLGSMNFAVVISKYALKDDVRGYGSGNAGMTNMLRTFGAGPAALTALGDFLKGFGSAYLGRVVFVAMGVAFFNGAYVGMLFAILGHLFPLYFGFKGGKGIMAGLGALVVVNSTVAGLLLLIFAVVVLTTRTVSLGSICVAFLYPFLVYRITVMQGGAPLIDTVVSACIGLLVLYMHRANLGRIVKGTEKKITLPSKKKEDK